MPMIRARAGAFAGLQGARSLMNPRDSLDPQPSDLFPPDPLAERAAPDNPAVRAIDPHHGSASSMLQRIAAAAEGPQISVGALVDGLEGRAFGMLLLLFAIPTVIPFLVGVHSAVAVPLALLAGQIVVGRREPWLPAKIRTQMIDVPSFRKMSASVTPWIKRAEKITKPRFKFMTTHYAERILAIFIILFSAIIALPGPGTNGVPGLCVALIALGIIERDGLLATLGVVLGVVYGALFFTVGYAAITFAFTQMMNLF